jgi:hypothetical protein
MGENAVVITSFAGSTKTLPDKVPCHIADVCRVKTTLKREDEEY